MEHAKKQQEPKETITSSDTTALEEFDEKTTLFETMTKSKSFNKIPKERALYHALMESILEDEDAIDEGVADKLKKGSKMMLIKIKALPLDQTEGTSKSQPKSNVKSAQAEETVFEAGDTQEPHNQGQVMGNTDDQANFKATPKHDWFKKPERPPTPDSDWNVRKSIDFRPPQTWISKIDQAEKPPLSFDELISTPIDFSAYVTNHLKIDKLTQEHLVGPTFNRLKGTCKSRVELDYNFKECYKALTDQLDWNNPEGKEYPFDLSKPLSLIMVQDHQVVYVDYFINNDLKCIVILKLVEDLQLGVKSYQKRLNITKPETFRLMRSNELYKFSDGTLTSVRTVLHDIASNLRMDYLPKRRWSNLNRQRSRIMIKAINKMLLERRLMRNLEKFVGRRDYGEDFKLLERTI
ncbi:hypothetical protein Tco_0635264 [Tanacetum coccineum]